jgi:hypothetical protein
MSNAARRSSQRQSAGTPASSARAPLPCGTSSTMLDGVRGRAADLSRGHVVTTSFPAAVPASMTLCASTISSKV